MKRHIRKPTRAQACADKAKLSRERADQLVGELARTQGARMSAYRCPFGCVLEDGTAAWHIGHSREGTLRKR